MCQSNPMQEDETSQNSTGDPEPPGELPPTRNNPVEPNEHTKQEFQLFPTTNIITIKQQCGANNKLQTVTTPGVRATTYGL